MKCRAFSILYVLHLESCLNYAYHCLNLFIYIAAIDQIYIVVCFNDLTVHLLNCPLILRSVLLFCHAHQQNFRMEPDKEGSIMSIQVQSEKGQIILSALITVFQNHDGQTTLKQVCQEVPMIAGSEFDESDISAVLDAYTSETIACMPQAGQIACIFQDLGDGSYELIADDETLRALKGEAYSYVDPDLVSAKGNEAPADIPADQAGAAVISDEYTVDAEIEPQDARSETIQAAASASAQAPEETTASSEASSDLSALKAESEKEEELADQYADASEAAEYNAEVDDDIAQAEQKICEEKQKIADHEKQIERDSTSMMKSLHEMEIRHDQKVIDRKEKQIDQLKDQKES